MQKKLFLTDSTGYEIQKHFLLPSNSIRLLKICFCIKIRTLYITYAPIYIMTKPSCMETRPWAGASWKGAVEDWWTLTGALSGVAGPKHVKLHGDTRIYNHWLIRMLNRRYNARRTNGCVVGAIHACGCRLRTLSQKKQLRLWLLMFTSVEWLAGKYA
jgi:hypothetical protein